MPFFDNIFRHYIIFNQFPRDSSLLVKLGLNNTLVLSVMPQRKVNKRCSLPTERVKFDNVNFHEPQQIIDTIEPLIDSECNFTKRKLLHLALSVLGRLDPFVYEFEDRLELLRIAHNASQFEFEDIPSVNHQIAMFTKTMLSHCRSTTSALNADIVSSFTKYFTNLDKSEQTDLYKSLGKQLNKEIFNQSSSFPSAASLDLSSLMKWSTKDVLKQTDVRLLSFLDEATKVTFKHRDETETQ